jgi:4-hydroxybenzoate polyprenyltransferase
MADAAAPPLKTRIGPFARVRLILEAVRIQESLFALPFAYMGMLLAAGGLPSFHSFLWVTVAMIGARNAGMAFNRVLDREMDALNPRTANRHLPRGVLQPWELTALGLVGLALFFLAAAMLNPLALALSPVAALLVVGYSLMKRFTWLTHLALGLTLSVAPVGGWIGVTGSVSWEPALLAFIVATFAAGFDIFNTCQDLEFDRAHGVYSLPARFGLPAAFWVSRFLHVCTSLGLLALGLLLNLAWPFYIGWVIATALLVYEQSVLSPTDLSRLGSVFLKVNALISVTLFGFTFLAVMLAGR